MSGAVILFVGSTLPAAEAAEVLDATALGPAAHGDLLAAARSAPAAIGLIDGYFERVPAVWHKEILWAMSRGVRVYGAASMGALRAAELAPFGMIGVGKIFEAFRAGVLEADDEVAVRHASAEEGYRPTSEALVDMRATLEAATATGVISTEVQSTLVQLASRLHYPDRIYPRLLAEALRSGVDAHVVGGLERWLPTGRISQKAIDARAMLGRIGNDLRADPPAPRRSYFVPTGFWDRTCRELDSRCPPSPPEPGLNPRAVVDELRLDPHGYDLLRRAALLRVARRIGWAASPSEADVADATMLRRARLGLPAAGDSGTNGDDQTLLGTEDAALDLLAREQRGQLEGWVRAELRHAGDLRALESRARDKKRLLELHRLSDATPATLGIDRSTVLEDHCYAKGLQSHPSRELLARALDLPDALALQRLLVAERAYQRVLRGEHRG